MSDDRHFDWIIVGSGFGGSVSALRLSEKGYRVLVLEKGRRFRPEDFAKSNWDLRRWMWRPSLGLRGIFQMSFLPHVTVLHGVGVGGGSLTYANTLPEPPEEFFELGSWAGLADWKSELAPHYETAKRMLGAATNPLRTAGDRVVEDLAHELGREEHFRPTRVAVFFGEPGKRVPDPYFGGEGPDRVGCNACGACMTGCRVGAKNTLDRNYLYLAEKRGVEVVAETEVSAVRPKDGGGYRIETRPTFGGPPPGAYTADRVILAGGVMGTVPLLLKLREDPEGLPRLSPRVGDLVRTNNEAILGIVVPDTERDFSQGVAISSILHTDTHSHLEPVHFASGSGFFRSLILPYAAGGNAFGRLLSAFGTMLRHPFRWLRSAFVRDFARRTLILLYMRTLEGTLSLRLGRSLRTGFRRGLLTRIDDSGTRPTAFMPEVTDYAWRIARRIGGLPVTILTETLLGVPTTAHILGGACIGADAESGVIDTQHRVHGYDGLYVIDGSAISANPGVNPSLTITALAERAMAAIPAKGER